MKKVLFISLLLLTSLISSSFKTDKPAYRIFTSEGKNADFNDILKDALKSRIVYFGELHNNPISHWLQYELTLEMQRALGSKLILGAEMFETDNQLLLDEFTLGIISEKNFEKQSRLWPNYSTDYKPLLTIASEHNLKFVGTNVPRRYASIVHGSGFEGLDSLSDAAKLLFAPLPVPYDPELPSYKSMMEMGEMSDHVSPNLPKAQAIKDATMGYFIVSNLLEGQVMLHFNGSYHSQNKEGILWYVDKYKPGLRQMTITTVEQDSLDKVDEENLGLADYIILVPSSMTKTY